MSSQITSPKNAQELIEALFVSIVCTSIMCESGTYYNKHGYTLIITRFITGYFCGG